MPTLTTSRGRTYEFYIRRQSDGSYLSYIVRQPGYGSRSDTAIATHRLRDDAGRSYVCWTSKLHSERQALDVAKGWAVRTDVYIDTGTWKS